MATDKRLGAAYALVLWWDINLKRKGTSVDGPNTCRSFGPNTCTSFWSI